MKAFRILLLVAATSWAGTARASGWRVIASPDCKVSAIDRAFLASVFLKKATRWPDDEIVRPVDQRPDAAVRASFSQDVLTRSISAVKSFWQQSIFSGHDLPPPELDDDDAVVSYVLSHPGAVGYVSAAADVREAKVLTVK